MLLASFSLRNRGVLADCGLQLVNAEVFPRLWTDLAPFKQNPAQLLLSLQLLNWAQSDKQAELSKLIRY